MIAMGIPVKGPAPYLGRVIDAARGQCSGRLVVFNDGRHPAVETLCAQKNVEYLFSRNAVGIAAGRNAILSRIDADQVWFLDADAIPLPGCLSALSKALNQSGAAAVCGRAIEDPRGSCAAQWRARAGMQSYGPTPLDDAPGLLGLCMLMRTDILKDIGGFDQSFIEGGEDQEIAIRLRKSGHRVIYTPNAAVEHHPSGSFKDVIRQAHRHARSHARALSRHDLAVTPVLKKSAFDLASIIANDLHALDIRGAAVGTIMLFVRLAGYLLK